MGAAVATALVLVAAIVVAIVLGKTAFFILAATVVLLALYELMEALNRAAARRPATPVAVVGGGAIMTLAFLERPALISVAVVATALLTIFSSLMPGRGRTPGSDAGWTLLGVLWIAGGGAAAVSLLTLSDDGVLLLLSLLLIVAVDDIFAYFGGTNLGKHKLAPSISPGKSWEGAIVGSTAAITMGAVVGYIMFDLSVFDGLALGLVAAVFNPIGDLFESMVKREIGIKDSGRLLPGHGGMLDRLDAILMCAPGFFLYLRLVVY
ncbi:MAG: phosphatidate cytidylyltransferase [Actinobacteria bacterium]|nr:phosphatidate cytidylyltransferase [Actinomycetota bacterium]